MAYIAIAAAFFVCFDMIHAAPTIINNERWQDDYLCTMHNYNTDVWSDCDSITDSNTIYHGPYSYFDKNSSITLSRSFQCRFDSFLSVNFSAEYGCSFDSNDSLYLNLKGNQHVITTAKYDDYFIDNSVFSFCENVHRIDVALYNITSVSALDSFDLEFEYDGDDDIVLFDIQIECIANPDPISNKNNVKWSTIASISYFSLYTCLMIMIAVKVYNENGYKKWTNFMKKIWNMKSVYGVILVHLYDTATDIGVIVEWWSLAQDEDNGINYETINMHNFVWASIGFMIFYRFVNVFMISITERTAGTTTSQYLFDVYILGFLDMYVLKTLYLAINHKKEEPTPLQRLRSLLESICESLPQIILQSVFIIRGFNDEELKKNTDILLVCASLGASILSVSNKYIWLDKYGFIEDMNEADMKRSCPCINIWWLSRVIWRCSLIAVRFSIYSLVWASVGGVFLPIYAAISWLYWLILYGIFAIGLDEFATFRESSDRNFCLLMSLMAMASNSATNSFYVPIFRFVENIITLSAITTFAVSDKIVCNICADSDTRQVSQNDYVLLFLIIAWVALFLEVSLTFILFYHDAFAANAREGTYDKIQQTVFFSDDDQFISNPLVIFVGIAYYDGTPKERAPELENVQFNNVNGVDADRRHIQHICDFLKYDLFPADEQYEWTKKEIEELISRSLEMLKSKSYDGLIFIWSGHAIENKIVTSDYGVIGKDQLHRAFSMNYPEIRNIPRIFIFEVSNGNHEWTPDVHESEDDEDDEDDEDISTVIPTPFFCDYDGPRDRDLWAGDEPNPDYKLIQIHAANPKFMSRTDSVTGSLLITRFTDTLMQNIKRTENRTLLYMMESIQEGLHAKRKQLPVNIFNNYTSGLTFRKNAIKTKKDFAKQNQTDIDMVTIEPKTEEADIEGTKDDIDRESDHGGK